MIVILRNVEEVEQATPFMEALGLPTLTTVQRQYGRQQDSVDGDGSSSGEEEEEGEHDEDEHVLFGGGDGDPAAAKKIRREASTIDASSPMMASGEPSSSSVPETSRNMAVAHCTVERKDIRLRLPSTRRSFTNTFVAYRTKMTHPDLPELLNRTFHKCHFNGDRCVANCVSIDERQEVDREVGHLFIPAHPGTVSKKILAGSDREW